MALIPGLIATMRAYKNERERLNKEAEREGKDGVPDFGPAMQFMRDDEVDEIEKSLGPLPQIRVPKPNQKNPLRQD